MKIPDKKIVKVLEDNLDEVLKDVLTGWDSPVKKMLQDSDSDFQKKLKEIAEKVFTEVLNDPSFQEKLKDRFLQTAIENMIRNK